MATISRKPSIADTGTLTSAAALRVYQRLYAAFGPQRWWPARTRWEVVIGTVLTQQAMWRSVETAVRRLRALRAVTPQGVQRLPRRRLERALRPTGYFRQKARRLKLVASRLTGCYGPTLAELSRVHPGVARRSLLEVNGIGQETADCIMVYAAGRPSVVIDEYTRRIAFRLGWMTSPRSTALRTELATVLPPDPVLLNEWHALIVALGKQICRRRPRCGQCPLVTDCPTGARTLTTTSGYTTQDN